MIHVTKSYLPDINDYIQYLEKIWANQHLTNDGPLVKELEAKLAEYLEVEHFIYVGNGTIALQLAIKALGLSGDVITTPFSYCATTNSLIWEKCNPIYADIDPVTLTVTSEYIKQKINSNTQAILTTHVYGNAGDLKEQEELAKRFQIPLIYDGAHAFGVKYRGKSIFNYGTVSTCSFHATKIFHTVEGGAIMTNDSKLAEKIRGIRSFGHRNDDYFDIGINGKNSEFHAAMGLVNFSKFDLILSNRKHVCELYDLLLADINVRILKFHSDIQRNYSYYPVIFQNELQLLQTVQLLNDVNIFPRRYFYPSLNTLDIINGDTCFHSEDIAKRILCLPLSTEFSDSDIHRIVDIIKSSLN